MGNILNLSNELGEYEVLSDISSTSTSTSTPSKLVKVFFDPRSPSMGIERTPIQVAATPRPVNDPRSPSVGIERTPIVEGLSYRSDLEALSMRLDILESSVDEEIEINNKSPTCSMDKLIEGTQIIGFKDKSSEDSAISLSNTVYEDATDLGLTNKNTDSTTISNLIYFEANENKQCNIVKVNKISPKDPSRSPLTPKNIISDRPSLIIQRKQIMKAVEKMNKEMLDDKENIFFSK